jgi:hypothetical protein
MNAIDLDCLAFHVEAARTRSLDHNTRRSAIRLANRWGGQEWRNVTAPRHLVVVR